MPNTKTSAIPLIFFAIISIAAMVAGMYFSGHLSVKPKPVITGKLFDKPKLIDSFSLRDAHNQSFEPKGFKGKWSFVFFGYTNCSEICTKTMKVLRNSSVEFAKHPEYFSNTRFIYISTDPERDSPKKLAKYISYFGDKFSALTGTKSQIAALSRQFKNSHKLLNNKIKSRQSPIHNGNIMLINPQGEWQAILYYPHNSKKMVYDYSSIRGYIKSTTLKK